MVVSLHQALHPSNYNIRRIVCELAMEGKPMGKTTFFSEHVRRAMQAMDGEILAGDASMKVNLDPL